MQPLQRRVLRSFRAAPPHDEDAKLVQADIHWIFSNQHISIAIFHCRFLSGGRSGGQQARRVGGDAWRPSDRRRDRHDPEATRRRVAAFRQVLPGLRRLGVFFDPGFPPDRTQLANLERVAAGADLTLVKREAPDAETAARLLRELGPGEVDAVFFRSEPLHEAGPGRRSAGPPSSAGCRSS